jgi:hypothetical protein
MEHSTRYFSTVVNTSRFFERRKRRKRIKKRENKGIKRHKVRNYGKDEGGENVPAGSQNIRQMERTTTLCRTSCIYYIIIYIIEIL